MQTSLPGTFNGFLKNLDPQTEQYLSGQVLFIKHLFHYIGQVFSGSPRKFSCLNRITSPPASSLKLETRIGMSDFGIRISESENAQNSEFPNPTSDVEPEDKFLKKLRDMVEKGISAPDMDIAKSAKKLAMSRSQLFRKVKALTGKSPSVFVRRVRLERATHLLGTTQLNISEIAYEVGFTDPSYFTNSFREEFGVPPSDYRTSIIHCQV